MHHSKRLTLDRPVLNDFDRFFAIDSDPETNLFNPLGPMNLESARLVFSNMLKHWDDHQFGSWTIKISSSETIIGFGGLSYRTYGNELKLNLGDRFDTAFWGKGYATELANFSIHYGLHQLQLEKIFALVRPKHAASIKVLEKCNMQLFGKLDDVPNEANSLVYVIEKYPFKIITSQ